MEPLIIIPAYNVEKNLSELLSKFIIVAIEANPPLKRFQVYRAR